MWIRLARWASPVTATQWSVNFNLLNKSHSLVRELDDITQIQRLKFNSYEWKLLFDWSWVLSETSLIVEFQNFRIFSFHAHSPSSRYVKTQNTIKRRRRNVNNLSRYSWSTFIQLFMMLFFFIEAMDNDEVEEWIFANVLRIEKKLFHFAKKTHKVERHW